MTSTTRTRGGKASPPAAPVAAGTAPAIPEAQLGPAERLLDVILNSSAHLWHNRPGLDVNGVWHPQRHEKRGARGKAKTMRGVAVRPGLFVPAAATLYGKLLDIYLLNVDLMAHFAPYYYLTDLNKITLGETEWRDLKVACAALMLVQSHAGEPIKDDKGAVAFRDDDHRAVGEAMILYYEKKSTKMLTPKAVLRVAELLETTEIAALNHAAGFGDPASKKPPLGRWKRAATKWLGIREKNPRMLEGLVKAGYKETIKKIARKAGYKPETQAFFEILGWKQKQAEAGHRTVGLAGDMKLAKRERFDGVSEAEICEQIESNRLSYKDVVGRLPKDIGLTPAIMVACLPSLSDRDLRMLTPTLEELGLMVEPTIRARWEKAVLEASDQRSLNISKNVRSKDLKEKLEEASDNAAKKAVLEVTKDVDLHVMFLIDKSGSMQGAIEQSKEALSRILAGFPADKLHIATFDTMGTVLKPKAASRAAVQHMLQNINAAGGTVHGAAVRALYESGVRVPDTAKLIVIVVGDEAGEQGKDLARAFHDHKFAVHAVGILVSVASGRGRTVQDCARELGVPFSEVQIEQFDDPYQVPRVLKALLDAPKAAGVVRQSGWVERVMKTPLLQLPS